MTDTDRQAEVAELDRRLPDATDTAEVLNIVVRLCGAEESQSAPTPCGLGEWLLTTLQNTQTTRMKAFFAVREAYDRRRTAGTLDELKDADKAFNSAKTAQAEERHNRKKTLAFLDEANARLGEVLGGLKTDSRWLTDTGGRIDPSGQLHPSAGVVVDGRLVPTSGPLYAHHVRTLEADEADPRPVEFLSIFDVNARWAQGFRAGRKLKHPLLPIVRRWLECRAAPLEKRHVITVSERDINYSRMPAYVDLATLSPVEAVMVDGEPLASGGLAHLSTWRRIRRPKPEANGQRVFPFAGPDSIGGTTVKDVVIRALADLPRSDLRSPLIGDVHRLSALAFALTEFGPIPQGLGAVFIGGADTPANRKRWWTACRFLRNLDVTIDHRTGEFVTLANVDPDGAGGVHIGPPAWWRGRGDNAKWRLSGALWRPVNIGGGGLRGGGNVISRYAGVARTLAGLEARLSYSSTAGRGRRGRVPDALRPASRGGPGMEVWVRWRDVLTLAGENVKPDASPLGTDGRRYRRRVEALEAAGYVVEPGASAAKAGDTIELVKIMKGGRNHEAGLFIRASARFCAAASGQQRWERLPAGHIPGLS